MSHTEEGPSATQTDSAAGLARPASLVELARLLLTPLLRAARSRSRRLIPAAPARGGIIEFEDLETIDGGSQEWLVRESALAGGWLACWLVGWLAGWLASAPREWIEGGAPPVWRPLGCR